MANDHHPLLACYLGRKMLEPDFGVNLLATYRRYSRYAQLSAPVMRCLQRPNPDAHYHLVGRRLLSFASGDPGAVQLIGNPLDYRACRGHGVPFLANNRAWPLMARAMQAERVDAGLAAKVEAYAAYLGGFLRGGYLLVWNDSYPVERLMVLAARKAGIPSICIQHGLLHKGFPHGCGDGLFADYMFVYDAWQREIFAGRRGNDKQVIVMGFHRDFPGRDQLPDLRSGLARRICFLGEAFAVNDRSQGVRHLEIARAVVAHLQEAGYDVVYKPHPGEDEAECRQEFDQVVTGSMEAVLPRFDVFVSTNSTALLEASLNRRVAVQVRDAAFYADDFEAIGYAYSRPSSEIDSLAGLIGEAQPLRSPMLDAMVAGTAVDRLRAALAQVQG